MKQPIKNSKTNIKKTKNKVDKKPHNPYKSHGKKKINQKYGTSKLERDFARDFLEKNGIKFIYEYCASDISRYYDFAIVSCSEIDYEMEVKDGIRCIKQEGQYVPISFMIEVDGGYFHSDPRVVKEGKLTPMQKHNKFVDKLKDKWCGMNCIPLLRIWENDIRKNPKKVMDMICEYLTAAKKRKMIMDNKKRPH